MFLFQPVLPFPTLNIIYLITQYLSVFEIDPVKTTCFVWIHICHMDSANSILRYHHTTDYDYLVINGSCSGNYRVVYYLSIGHDTHYSDKDNALVKKIPGGPPTSRYFF